MRTVEFGTAVCTGLAEIHAELRKWRARANSAAAAVTAEKAADTSDADRDATG